MMVRVFRAQVRAGKQVDFQRKVEQLSIPLGKSQPGMLAYYAGKPAESTSDEFVMVTLWDSLASLKDFAGEDWSRAVIPEEELPLLEETFVHHYEVSGSSEEGAASDV